MTSDDSRKQKLARKPRSDGQAARQRILSAALRLFAEHGFHNTSVREIAALAGNNSAAISYYFEDKAGLYRAAWQEVSFEWPAMSPLLDAAPPPSAEQFVHSYICQRLSTAATLRDRVRLRELLEPTGLVDFASSPGAPEQSLQRSLAHALGAEPSDDGVLALAAAIESLLTLPVVQQAGRSTGARSLAGPDFAARLSDYVLAMLSVELRRRGKSLHDACW